MLTEQEQYTCAQFTIQLPELVATARVALQPEINIPERNDTPLFRFVADAPATLAERYPHLMVFAVSAAVLLAAVTAEIECLRGSGYFWR